MCRPQEGQLGWQYGEKLGVANMEPKQPRALTQVQLVEQLHERGCTDVSTRRVAIWRANDLLPPFDLIGSGRGRSGGRNANAWIYSKDTLNQALWVYQLLKTHKTFVELYLPLWILGFPIPILRIRDGLAKPLETTTIDVTFEIDGRNAIEDYIDDAAYEFSQGMKRANWNVLDMPQETLAAILNILLNSAYNMEDQPFEDGVDALGEWERNFQQKCFEFLNDAKSVSDAEQMPNESGIFRHAEFVNEFLSIPHLRQVVAECTDADLLAVGKDVEVGRQIILEIRRLLPILLPYVPEELQPSDDELIETILSVGKVCMWIDLSLRRSGYGDLINYVLAFMLDGIRKQSLEELGKVMTQYGPEISEMLTMVKELGMWLGGMCENEVVM